MYVNLLKWSCDGFQKGYDFQLEIFYLITEMVHITTSPSPDFQTFQWPYTVHKTIKLSYLAKFLLYPSKKRAFKLVLLQVNWHEHTTYIFSNSILPFIDKQWLTMLPPSGKFFRHLILEPTAGGHGSGSSDITLFSRWLLSQLTQPAVVAAAPTASTAALMRFGFWSRIVH